MAYVPQYDHSVSRNLFQISFFLSVGTMGIQTDLNDRSPADVIPGASHCADLSSNSPNDTPRMREVRDRIFSLVRLWIGVD